MSFGKYIEDTSIDYIILSTSVSIVRRCDLNRRHAHSTTRGVS